MNNDQAMVIGILGGMGTYATIDFFKRLADAFPAEKEWERPRVIVDNHCTMPSRVRALLYGEKREELVADMTSSIDLLRQGGASDIILACNTSHCFLPDIFAARPELKKSIIHIIELCCEQLHQKGVKEVYLIATEGTIATNIYGEYLSRYHIDCVLPTQDELLKIRDYIEAVKQNAVTEQVKKSFYQFLTDIKCPSVILGCTEIPVVYGKLDQKPSKDVYDPLQFTIEKLKSKFLKLG